MCSSICRTVFCSSIAASSMRTLSSYCVCLRRAPSTSFHAKNANRCSKDLRRASTTASASSDYLVIRPPRSWKDFEARCRASCSSFCLRASATFSKVRVRDWSWICTIVGNSLGLAATSARASSNRLLIRSPRS
jgi:hypothetical protein